MTARLEDMGKAEFTELANAGSPIYQALAKATGKTTDEIVKMSSQSKISTESPPRYRPHPHDAHLPLYLLYIYSLKLI